MRMPGNELDRWARMTTSSSLEDDVMMGDRRLGHPSMHGGGGGSRKQAPGRRSNRPSSSLQSHRVASLEIPLRLDDSGLSLERKTNMSVYSTFPVSGPWRAGLGGSTRMRGRTGYSTGKGDIYYSLGSFGNLRGGVTVGEHPNLIFGGTFLAGGSAAGASSWDSKQNKTTSVTATIQTRPRNWAQSGFSISTRHMIDPRLTILTSSSLNPSRKMSFRINLLSKTMHQCNLGLGWQQQRPLFSLQLTPLLWFSSRRLLQLSASWYGGKSPGWTVGGTLSQKPTQQQEQPLKPSFATPSKLSVGLTHSSLFKQEKRVVWIFSLTQGEFTLRVPIVLGAVVSASSSFWYALQVSYFCFLSVIIQDIIADVLQLDSNQSSDKELAEQQRQLKREKSRTDAAQQQRFMERQAKIRTQTEEDKGGLRIMRAVYHVDGGDRWDVTIPLQFWVADSSLRLAGSSKRNMLGFYNVAASVAENRKSSPVDDLDASPSSAFEEKNRSHLLGWLWKPLSSSATGDGESSTPTVSVKLSVQYQVGTYSYEITIQDDEELFLPSPKAVVIDKSTIQGETE